MLRIIPFTIVLLLFAANSYTQPPFIESYERLPQDAKVVIDSVIDSFLKNHIIFLGEISNTNELIGASAMSDTEVVTGEKLPDSHYELDVAIHEKEHLVVIILPAEKGADDFYHTPVKLLGNKAYSYKVLHKVKIHENYITFSSSMLSDKRDSRSEIEPNPRLIKEIAANLKGEISNNKIKLQ